MDNQIKTVYDAIANGTLDLTAAKTFTDALATDAWGVIAKLAHLVAMIQQGSI